LRHSGPEPTTALLMPLGLSGLALRRPGTRASADRDRSRAEQSTIALALIALTIAVYAERHARVRRR
jgi:hypothetical protein